MPTKRKTSGPVEPMPDFEVVDIESDVDIASITPCPKCKSRRKWWNVLGHERCLDCAPPNTAIRLLKLKHKFQVARKSAT